MSEDQSHSKYITVPPETEEMPPGIPYIVGNEAAERFSFYGMKAILVVFMTKYLYLMSDTVQPAMSNAEAQEHYHTFNAWVYFFPIFGALISDAITGKYPIILWVSMLYCLGHLSLALMGTPGISPDVWMWIGLILISIGSGGIKPCVSAHVGDQFGAKNQHLMNKVYQWFYFSINFGSFFSYLLTPYLLEWYGPHVAFGIPGILMGIATLAFWMGRNKFVHIPPAGAGFLKEVFSKKGILTIAKLGIVYVAISVFWALFDQTGSAWVLQAEDMDLTFMGITWLPSQIGFVNPILVLILIPTFQFGIYPAIDKVFPLTPLRKIAIGLFVTTFAFAISAIAQNWIDTGSQPSIGWQLFAYVILTSGEIMVSITGLEFSYSQAPKAMKSIIMSLWLASVSLGNYVTATVNHAIQVPSINGAVSAVAKLEADDGEKKYADLWLAKVDKPSSKDDKKKSVQIAGFDQKFGTEDDFTLNYDSYGNLTGIETGEDDYLESAKEKIDEYFFASDEDDASKSLPDNKAGNDLIGDVKDSNGNKVKYERVTQNRYRLISLGADKQANTPWDITLLATVSRAVAAKKAGEGKTTPYSWREKRIIELKGEEGQKEVDAARGEIPETEISSEITVGGRVTLEGANYYWFWTGLMLAAAVVFVPIAYFYKDQSQLAGEPVDSDEAEVEKEIIQAEAEEEATGGR